jgi:hypothetical protein
MNPTNEGHDQDAWELEEMAEELEVALRAKEAGQQQPAPMRLPRAQADLGTALADLAETTIPSPDFAARLEAQMRIHAGRPPSQEPSVPQEEAAPTEGLGSTSPQAPLLRLARPAVRRFNQHPQWRIAAAMAAGFLLALILVPIARAGVEAALGAVHIRWSSSPVPPASSPTPTLLPSLLDLAGETTLAEAQRKAGFAIRLPSYPPDLGPPQHVFFQNLGGPAVVLVWTDPQQPDRVRMSLQALSSDDFVWKVQPQKVEQASVHGKFALWFTGPYVLQYRYGAQISYDVRYLVTGHALVWVDQDGVTYRLETDQPLPAAVRIAESLR